MFNFKNLDRCYIIGGGPSLKGFDFSLFKTKFTIAINHSYHYIPNCKAICGLDPEFWYECKEMLKPFEGITITHGHNIRELPINSYPETIVQTGFSGIDLKPGFIRTGNNSSYAAVNLAIQWGFKNIYLFGIDAVSGGHFYDNKSEEYIQLAMFYETLMKSLPYGVNLYNCSPISNVKAVPYLSFEEALSGRNYDDKYIKQLIKSQAYQ